MKAIEDKRDALSKQTEEHIRLINKSASHTVYVWDEYDAFAKW